MRFGFAASAPFGAEVLERLAGRHEIPFVLTQPDAPAGRGRGLRPAPAKLTALKLGLPVIERLEDLPDEPTIVLVAYGRLIPRDLLDRHLWLNVHPSLLPRWRGAAPVERALMAGDDGDRGHADPARRGARRRADRGAGGVPDRAGGRRRVGVTTARPSSPSSCSSACCPSRRSSRSPRRVSTYAEKIGPGRPPARPLAAGGSGEPGPGALPAHRRPRGAE